MLYNPLVGDIDCFEDIKGKQLGCHLKGPIRHVLLNGRIVLKDQFQVDFDN